MCLHLNYWLLYWLTSSEVHEPSGQSSSERSWNRSITSWSFLIWQKRSIQEFWGFLPQHRFTESPRHLHSCHSYHSLMLIGGEDLCMFFTDDLIITEVQVFFYSKDAHTSAGTRARGRDEFNNELMMNWSSPGKSRVPHFLNFYTFSSRAACHHCAVPEMAKQLTQHLSEHLSDCGTPSHPITIP